MTACEEANRAMKTREPNAFIVLWDFPQGTTSLGMFYRRLADLLRDQGGKTFCRSTKSAYIVRGDGAKELAYAIGALAERFGAGQVGVENGTVVLPLANVPEDHFELMRQARFEVDTLCLDRRKRANRGAPHGSVASSGPARENGGALAKQDLAEFLEEQVGAESLTLWAGRDE